MEEFLKQANELLKVQGQKGNCDYDHYMRGLYNGMEMIIALAENREPLYKDGEIDYTKLNAVQLMDICKDDARKWAQAFMQITRGQVVDEGLMIAWFANVIEVSYDVRKNRM